MKIIQISTYFEINSCFHGTLIYDYVFHIYLLYPIEALINIDTLEWFVGWISCVLIDLFLHTCIPVESHFIITFNILKYNFLS